MPMVADPHADPHFYHATLGALLIGFSVSCGVFGVLSQQTMTYYQRYFHDKIVYKLMVGFLWFFQCIDVVLVGYSVYHYTITHYGDFAYLVTQDVLWSLIVQILLAALVGTAVKCAFALRVWSFSKKNVYVTGGIVFLIVAQTAFALAYCVKAFEIRKLEYASQLRTIATLSLAAGVVTDLAIAMALCYFLRKLRTGFKKSDSLVNMLCIYAINTGALTAAVSATVLILYNVYPEYLYFMGSYFVLGNLYAISFICTLNTRRVIRGAGTDNQNSTSENSRGGPIFMITNPSNGNRPSHAGNNMSPTSIMSKVDINVRREITVLTDIESQEHTLDAKDTPTSSPSPIKSVSPFR
ncbi:hypothetical protein DFP72DRAFT_587818 [Ephemerocybe angulata]|uniref:DUF6534 domain-containing protein n=1 Tax=Ephemerocybe angulata TaxID=980116 RepID=A0A8H6HLB8_9AGAR|nr:hypothetical protein DFP72DRAFT_587818 [Tulosesus angulatus]